MSTGKNISSDGPVSSPEPLASTIVGVILSFSAISVLSCFLAHKFLSVKDWWRLPFITWLVVAIYADSWIFVFGTAIIDYGIGVDSNLGVCSAAILFRVARMEDDQCIIGIKRQALIPLITFDILVNIYLTVLFLNPLQNIYLGKGLTRWPPNPPRLRAAGIRTFIGALATTTSSVVNLTVLMVLDGELGWVCLICCNADILFSALIIQWLTTHDATNPTTAAALPSSGASASDKPSALSSVPSRSRRRRNNRPTISLPLNATSTSQYEHIFGDPEPDASQLHLEADVDNNNTNNNSHSAKGTAATTTTANDPGTTLSYFSFDDSDQTPATNGDDDNDDDEIDIGAGAAHIPTRNRSAPQGSTSRRHPWTSTAATSASASVHTVDPRPRMGRARRRESGATTGSGNAVAAAVAADLERIRLYRQRRPTPSRAALAVAQEAGDSAYPYRISHLAFEGGGEGSGQAGEDRWYDFVRAEEDDAEGKVETGPAGWI
ncbi:hypothetical protein GGR53DRAFT_528451 [Hypoxylon sp. FL1150]|nr:hypothetical protein GGR53DRAFT_528451 [Hypoxylon sp. FL1150]